MKKEELGGHFSFSSWYQVLRMTGYVQPAELSVLAEWEMLRSPGFNSRLLFSGQEHQKNKNRSHDLPTIKSIQNQEV